MVRAEFLSPEWLSALEEIAQRLLDEAAAPATQASYAEVFTGVPPDLEPTPPIGYLLAFADGRAKVTSAASEEEPADCRVRIDFGVALATLQTRSGPALDAVIEAAFVDGRMAMSGKPGALPIDMNRLHDALLERTEASAA